MRNLLPGGKVKQEFESPAALCKDIIAELSAQGVCSVYRSSATTGERYLVK